MKRLVHTLVLVLFCFYTGCFGNPVPKNANNHVWIYKYTGNVDTATTACNESLARWTISGNLSLYYNEDYMVAKLDDVKTSLFNGPKSKLQSVKSKEIPEESKALLQPFVIKRTEDKSVHILLKPNEPLWSVNMKKAIASFLDFDLEVFANEKPEQNEIITRTFSEESIYGKCNGDFVMGKMEPESDVKTTFYEKSMKFWNCTERPVFRESNPLNPIRSTSRLDILDFETGKALIMDDSKEALWEGSSNTKIVYKLMENSPYSLTSVQGQAFTLLESVEVEKTIDISEHVDERNLIYEFGDDPTSGRHIYETDQSVLVKEYLENYDIFEKNFNNPPVDNFDIRKDDPVEKMFMSLLTIDYQGLKNIEKAIRERKDNFDLANFYYALLPYVGTNETVKYINKILQTFPNKGNSPALLKLLAIFPQHIMYPTDDVLVSLEPLMELTNMEHQYLKNAGILSFASAVGRACRENMISKKYLTKYVEHFHITYLGGPLVNYEAAMVYLLGLINMVDCLDLELINRITTNTTEAPSFRALAMDGFKNHLRLNARSEIIYDTYWPIVLKKSEPFDVRVAALDLLLNSYLTKEQIDTIVDKYSQHVDDPEEKQLQNYLRTSLHSLQNSNWYVNNYIGAKATKTLKEIHIPAHPKAWATGNYRLSFTDNEPNVGAYFDTRLVTDPKTNIVNSVQLTFNSFATSFDFGTYSLFLKFDGLLNWNYVKQYLESIKVSSVPELLQLLKDNKYKLKGITKEFRCDMVLFVDNVAVFAKFMENLGQDEIYSLGDELEEILTASKYISYPVMDYTHIPSDLGTPIIITNNMQDISKTKYAREHLKYRSSWYFQTWIELHNPLIDTKIASYKYYIDEKNVNIKFSANVSASPTFTLVTEDDTYTQFWDNMMGTAVEEEEILKQYCQDCESFSEVPTDNYTSYSIGMEPFGFQVELRRSDQTTNPSTSFSDFYFGNIHQPNVDAFPLAAPALLLAHMHSRKFWLQSELSRGSYRSHANNASYETTLSLDVQGNIRNKFNMENHMNITAKLETKDLADDKVLNYANLTYGFDWIPNYNDKDGNKHSILYEVLNFRYFLDQRKHSAKICVNRETPFPGLRGDKLSLKPSETTNGKIVLITAKNFNDDEDCIPEIEYIFTDVFSNSDKEKILEDKNMLKDYEQCLSDSKDLKFTAPTAECKRISSRLTEYDNYEIFLKIVTHYEDHNKTEDIKQPFFKMARVDEDKLQFSLLKIPRTPENPEEAYYNYSIYYPKKIINPNWLAYNDHDIALPRYATSTCTIAPAAIEQFSGKYIPNPKKEWLAFAECYNVSTRGLIGHTIGDRNVGFTFYSNEHVVAATVIDGKANIKINGTEQNEYNNPFDHFRVQHLDENVFHIRDAQVEIYYNTEYVSVKVTSMYDNLLCGVCTQEN